MTDKIKTYKKEFDYSYTSGAYATIEMIKIRPEIVRAVYIHPEYRDSGGLTSLCRGKSIACLRGDKIFHTLNQKENTLVLGVFGKTDEALCHNAPHIVLVNPSDMGNLGTIIRTMAGLNIKNLAVIKPAADIFDPKTVRASMGSLFHIRHALFDSFEEYAAKYPLHNLFPFMLGGTTAPEDIPPCRLFSLIFGSEASGLDESFAQVGQSVRIPLSACADSYNLAVAAGIGAYVFAVKNELF